MRKSVDLKKNWLFSRTCGAAPAAMPEGDGWEAVTLPHSWNAVDGQNGQPFQRGAYWYVTSFEAPEQPIPGGSTYIEVGAAALVGEIWVNGQFAGRHVGGYSAFRADVTSLCRPGENVLAILCDNRYSEKVYPQRADFTFYGGLYRYVKVVSVPESRITLDHFGDSGVFVDAEPADGGATVRVRVLLDGVKEKQTVSVTVLDEEGNELSESWGFAEKETVLDAFIPEAKLWDGPDSPALYKARVRLVSLNEVIDEVETAFGARSFQVDPERGFLLNGHEHPLRGVCRHQDRLYLGNALTKKEHDEDAEIIAEMGANTIRLAHYQQAAEMYDACDRHGLVVWAEIPYFAQSWDDDAHAAAVNEIKELVAQNYNHPSICFWGLSNEILMAGNDNPKLLGCHKDLNDAVKSLDEKRITVIAHEYGAGWDHPLHESSDAEGWNHYFGWYRGQMGDLAKWCDEYHEKYPERRFAITEYGCDSVVSYHSDEPVKMDYTEEYQVLIHENACETFAARPWIWGTFVWNMFDFGSSFRREGGTLGRNNKGLVTLDRKIKKDSFYVYKAWFGREPFVHIDGRRYFARPGKTTTVRVHSNLPEVTLFVDGRRFAAKSGAHTFVFENVPLDEAGTVLTARAGGTADTVTLRRAKEMPAPFTFEGFKQTQDAINWFESVEEVAGTLEVVPGHFSVHDKMRDILANDAAKKVFLDGLTAAAERALPEQMLTGLVDADVTLADATGTGFLATLFAGKREQALRKLHAALSRIEKQL